MTIVLLQCCLCLFSLLVLCDHDHDHNLHMMLLDVSDELELCSIHEVMVCYRWPYEGSYILVDNRFVLVGTLLGLVEV